MGFYIELQKRDHRSGYYEEHGFPAAFWVLYSIAVFAVFCMGAAAFTVLSDLLRQGEWYDKIVLYLLFFPVPFLFVIGLKMAFLRKFIELNDNQLTFGFKTPFEGLVFLRKSYPKSAISDCFLINKRQSANLGKFQHDDPRYHIRGHWKVLAESQGKRFVLDRHTEKECLEPLYQDLKDWLKKS